MRKKLKTLSALLLIFAMVIANTQVYGTVIVNITKKNIKKITLNHTSQTMYVGNNLKLKVKEFSGSNSSNIIWSSSNKQVATVTNTGKVKTRDAGSVTITAKLKKNKSIKATCNIKVYDKTKNIELISDDNYTLSIGDILKLEADVTESDEHTKPIIWASSDDSIASITNNGIVTAINPGSVQMIASSGEKSVSVNITVQDNVPDESNTTTVPIVPTAPVTTPTSSISRYTITFNSNGGTPVGKQIVESGKRVTRPSDPLKAQYSFGGWYKDDTLISLYDFSASVSEDITLYAKWNLIPQDTCTVIFNTNGGNSIPNQTVAKGSKITAPNNPIKYGYTFLGWYLNSTLTIQYSFSDAVNEDMVLYARWSDNNKYTVIFDSNGGSYVEPQVVEFPRTVIYPNDPIRYGYTFAGWFMNSSLTIPFDFSLAVTQDITLYARWIDNNYIQFPGSVTPTVPTYPTSTATYTVIFDSNGGSEVSSQTITERQFAKRPDSPKKSGYVFTGWYTSLDFDEIFIFEYMPVMKDITLYARWMDKGIFNNIPSNPVESSIPTVPTYPIDEPNTPTKPSSSTSEIKKNKHDVAVLDVC